MQLSWGARSSRPLPSASRRRAGHNHLVTPFSEWILPPRLFGETPNRATETVALLFSDCMVPYREQLDCVLSAKRSRLRPAHLRHHPLELAHFFHHLLHLIKAIQQDVQLRDTDAAAFGDALAP